ncbi:MAG: hypothetical protein WBS14_20850 [Rhodomicrobium sp.]
MTSEKHAHHFEQLTDFMTKAMDAWSGVLPSNPMTAVFKEVQGRAMEIAKVNAESVFTFAGKISNALTQEQMQAFAAQTQELQRLIGEAVPKLQHG